MSQDFHEYEDEVLARIGANNADYNKGHDDGYAAAIAVCDAEIAALRAELSNLREHFDVVQDTLDYLQGLTPEQAITLRPAAEALKTAVEWATASPSGLCLAWFDGNVAIGTDEKLSEEPTNGDPLAATIRAINRAAESIGENHDDPL